MSVTADEVHNFIDQHAGARTIMQLEIDHAAGGRSDRPHPQRSRIRSVVTLRYLLVDVPDVVTRSEGD